MVNIQVQKLSADASSRGRVDKEENFGKVSILGFHVY